MSIDRKTTGILPHVLAELQEAAELAKKGIRNPEAAKKARQETDRVREEIFQKHGILNIGTPAIRELRDE